jgi:acyl-[acyl-carrier-protein]-phospholipid O-acyltransferase/long-chain-fatty-acid--[acyl-carrier-protein] ligase
MRHGWYVTGDIVRIDKDGFITITDRLSRFSKIGGEMVPHGAVEDVLQDGSGAEARAVAVTAVKDERRGERLVVVYTAEAGDADTLKGILAGSELPNLWKPRGDDYVEVPELPLLGSGKLDLKQLRALAERRAGPEGSGEAARGATG